MLSHIDALVVAAPPDVTLGVTLAAVAAGVPVFVTKPLMLTEALELKAAFFVDYVKLWSPIWHKFKRAHTLITDVEIEFYGDGPVRTFPGLLDYGAHALAYAHDLLGTSKLDIRTATVTTKRTDGSHIVTVNAFDNKVPVTITTGNGAKSKRRRVTVNGAFIYEDDPYEDPLKIMVHEFIDHVRAGRADPRLMRLTCAVTASLNTIRSACALDQ
jgi:predicted dehydrogenase